MDDSFFFVNKHIYTVDYYWCIVGFLNSSRRHNGVDISITLDSEASCRSLHRRRGLHPS